MADKNLSIISAVQFHVPSKDEAIYDPNTWFAEKFPEATEIYGPAFLEARWTDTFRLTHITPAHLNADFFAAILGGDVRLGHQVVYYGQEARFYFYDPLVDAFCPTSGAKLQLLVSNYLVRCSQACSGLTDIHPLFVTFRDDKVLQSIVEKAKAMLEASADFFQGASGHKRFIDGKYLTSTDVPSYVLFARKALVRHPEGKVTVLDAYHGYYRFCGNNHLAPLSRSEFRHLFAEAIREAYNLGLRHDVESKSGKLNHGWVGIECRLDQDG